MKRLALLVTCLAITAACLAQQQLENAEGTKNGDPKAAGVRPDGLVPLSPPYAISTAPHFAIMLQFPRADSIRRIALGDSSYFLAEADKEDPHYAIVKQVRVSKGAGKAPIETNMLVYMASGRVVNVTLKSGTLAQTAYLIDYAIPTSEHAQIVEPLAVTAQVAEKRLEEQTRKRLADEMLHEAESSPQKQPVSVAGGLGMHLYRIERHGELALVSFDIENKSSTVIDVEGPQVNLTTFADKSNKRKRAAPANVEPVQLVDSSVSSKQLSPGTRAICLVAFKPPVHDSNQHVVLWVANRAMADQPATAQIE